MMRERFFIVHPFGRCHFSSAVIKTESKLDLSKVHKALRILAMVENYTLYISGMTLFLRYQYKYE